MIVPILFIFLSAYEFMYALETNSELAAILFVGFALNAYVAYKAKA